MSDEPDISVFAETVARLRAPGGCPWDRAQTHSSLARYLVEETHECVDAIASGEDDALRDELGDVLLQVVLHSRIAEERGAFGLQDVIDGVNRKMIRRHPHVFGEATADSPEEVSQLWEEAKRAERATGGAEDGAEDGPLAARLDRLSRGLPPLARAERVAAAAAVAGFDWDGAAAVIEKVREEIMEVVEALDRGTREDVEEEIGDLLFAVVSLARHADVSADRALRRALRKFEGRVRRVEALAREEGAGLLALGADALDALWERVARGGRS
ncbi:MAG: nucleoside triphosphate pyrophosphohydrolase [Deltaproteobacteria bacterium]|nr:MAG: nucleoside triphosphate pyrophosphohydrolase [Deltaproteobacteria bacterium]